MSDQITTPVWNFGGATLTLQFAEKILSELSKTGSVTVVGIAPGSFSLVAMLEELVDRNRGLDIMHREQGERLGNHG